MNCAANLLDLLITRNSQSINDMQYQSPIGKSDHVVLCFNYECQIKSAIYNKDKYCYDIADYDSIRNELNNIDWDNKLKYNDVNKNWQYFYDVLVNLKDKFVQKRVCLLITKKEYH